MGTARLSNKDPRRDDTNLGQLNGFRKRIKKLLSMQFKEVAKELPLIIEKFPKRLVPDGFKELERAMNTLKSILEVPEDVAEEYAEEIAQSRQEIPEHVANALREVETKITKLEHSLQIGALKVLSKEVVDEEEGSVTVSGINSLSDLKSAFDNFVKKSREVEKRKAKAKEERVKPVPEFSEEEDFSAKALTLVTRFAAYQKRVPKNPDFEQVQGLFESPVMFQGMFNYSNTKYAGVEVYNIGSGFFLFESLPIVYCETGMPEEAAKARIKSVLDKHEKLTGVRLVLPDNGRFFRDYGSPNIQFQIAMKPQTFQMLSPFKSIEQAAFPWATSKQNIGRPKRSRSSLDLYIAENPAMVKLEDRAKKLVLKERMYSAEVDDIEDAIIQEEKVELTGIDKVWKQATIDNKRETLEEMKNKLRETRSKIRQLRTRKIELTKELRDKYVNRAVTRIKKRKIKR
jgi:hypothetical protein